MVTQLELTWFGWKATTHIKHILWAEIPVETKNPNLGIGTKPAEHCYILFTN